MSKFLDLNLNLFEEETESIEFEMTNKQKEAFDLYKNNKNVCFYGGFGSGKSEIGLYSFFQDIPKNGNVGLLMGFTTQSIRKRVNQFFTTYGFPEISKATLEFDFNGGRYILAGADKGTSSSHFRGLNVSNFYIDEPTAFGFLESSFLEGLKRLRVGARKCIITTNSSSPNHWVKEKVIDNNSFKSLQFTTFDNTFLPDVENYVKTIAGENDDSPIYQRDVLGNWLTDDNYPFSSMRIESFEIPNAYNFAFCDPSLKGVDKSAITFFQKEGKNWKLTVFADNLGVEDFLKQGKLKTYLDRTLQIYIEDNILGNFIDNLRTETGYKLMPYHTSTNKVKKILKLSLPISNKTIIFSDKSDRGALVDIANWRSGVKEQSDDSIDSVASGFEMWGVI